MTSVEKTSQNPTIGDLSAVKKEGAPRLVVGHRYHRDGSGGPGPKYLRTEALLGRQSDSLIDRFIVSAAEKILGIGGVNRICLKAGTPWPSSRKMIDHLFKELDIRWCLTNPEALESLKGKPAVFVANHPYGMPDAFAMNNLLEEHRPNFRLFANSFLASADSITHKLLFVDPFMNEKNRAMNRRSMVSALKHLKEGGDLCLFPGRICSHLKWGQRYVQDGEWTDQIRNFVDAGRANLVPIHISGRNSWRFQGAGLIHPKLRTLLIIREFMRGGHDIRFSIGVPVPAHALIKAGQIAAPGQIARALTYSANPQYAAATIQEASKPIRIKQKASPPARTNDKRRDGQRSKNLAFEIDQWPTLTEHKGLKVVNIGHGLPDTLSDAVADLRFNAYGQSSRIDDPSDLIDQYDQIYSHLVLWDSNKQQMAGTYRYVVPNHIKGGLNPGELVTASIFKFKKGFLDLVPYSLELGRAAIAREYQRSYAPLMLMWRGIMDILRRDKSLKYLTGPVTIPRTFSPLSRRVLKHFLDNQAANPALAGSAVPHHEFEAAIPPQIDLDDMVGKAKSITDIAKIVEALEGGKRKLPVLYRQYANVGLKYIATGQWPELDHAMASLSVLDLKDVPFTFIQRHLGKQNVAAFYDGR